MTFSSRVEIVAHKLLVPFSKGLANVYEVVGILGYSLKIRMLSFILHAPMASKWVNPTEECKHGIRHKNKD